VKKTVKVERERKQTCRYFGEQYNNVSYAALRMLCSVPSYSLIITECIYTSETTSRRSISFAIRVLRSDYSKQGHSLLSTVNPDSGQSISTDVSEMIGVRTMSPVECRMLCFSSIFSSFFPYFSCCYAVRNTLAVKRSYRQRRQSIIILTMNTLYWLERYVSICLTLQHDLICFCRCVIDISIWNDELLTRSLDSHAFSTTNYERPH
jgi:hypothetical protein